MNIERKVSEMHVVVASSAFDVSFPHLDRLPLGRIAARVRDATKNLRVTGRVLGLAAQGLMFATVMWLLVAAPGFLYTQENPVRMEPARQASR
jgi:hypothetical protein